MADPERIEPAQIKGSCFEERMLLLKLSRCMTDEQRRDEKSVRDLACAADAAIKRMADEPERIRQAQEKTWASAIETASKAFSEASSLDIANPYQPVQPWRCVPQRPKTTDRPTMARSSTRMTCADSATERRLLTNDRHHVQRRSALVPSP